MEKRTEDKDMTQATHGIGPSQGLGEILRARHQRPRPNPGQEEAPGKQPDEDAFHGVGTLTTSAGSHNGPDTVPTRSRT